MRHIDKNITIAIIYSACVAGCPLLRCVLLFPGMLAPLKSPLDLYFQEATYDAITCRFDPSIRSSNRERFNQPHSIKQTNNGLTKPTHITEFDLCVK